MLKDASYVPFETAIFNSNHTVGNDAKGMILLKVQYNLIDVRLLRFQYGSEGALCVPRNWDTYSMAHFERSH